MFPFFQLKLSTLSWNKLKKEVGHLGGWPTCKPQLHQKLTNKLFYFLNNNHLCWKSLFFSPFLVEKHRYLLTWKKKVGVWWPIYFRAFCVELEKRKKLFAKAFFRNGDFKTRKFWLKRNKHKFPICHPLLYYAFKMLTHSMQRFGCMKDEAPKICCNH